MVGSNGAEMMIIPNDSIYVDKASTLVLSQFVTANCVELLSVI